jgi:hypothetical protein
MKTTGQGVLYCGLKKCISFKKNQMRRLLAGNEATLTIRIILVGNELTLAKLILLVGNGITPTIRILLGANNTKL